MEHPSLTWWFFSDTANPGSAHSKETGGRRVIQAVKIPGRAEGGRHTVAAVGTIRSGKVTESDEL